MTLLVQSQYPNGVASCSPDIPIPDLPPGVQVSKVFDTFWYFASRRQEIFFSRLANPSGYPWTNDPTLIQNRFTNAYRASDRVSQYLIRKIINAEPDTAEEILFRILLFKFFNRIETWELLAEGCTLPSWRKYSFDRYDAMLTKAIESGDRIYSAAYIMPSGGRYARKHRHHLKLLEQMMADGLTLKLQRCKTMENAFSLLRSYPSIGNFLAYQFITDLNYSDLLSFSEMDFVCPGPGARDGIRKCFINTGGKSEEWLIRWMAETQEDQFERLGVTFRNLWGRRLQLIDCQNLFCEVDKYARYVHPEVTGVSGRTRIKQRFRPNLLPIDYTYPPKWAIAPNIREFGAEWGKSHRHITEIAAD